MDFIKHNNTNMATLIEAVKRQALQTFAKKGPSCFDDNLTKLKLLASKLTSADVKLDKSLLYGSEPEDDSRCTWPPQPTSRLAPVTYVEVFENTDITIGIFVLKSGARLPLHDHPLMHGVLKVIHGKVRILSYSPVSRMDFEDDEARGHGVESLPHDSANACDDELPSQKLHRQVSLFAVKEPELVVSENDEVCVLSPETGNIHEIRTVDGPAAFVDILAPPYHTDIPGVGPRPCHYYFQDVSYGGDANPVKKLIRIPSPSDYWSDSAPYEGPSCIAEN